MTTRDRFFQYTYNLDFGVGDYVSYSQKLFALQSQIAEIVLDLCIRKAIQLEVFLINDLILFEISEKFSKAIPQIEVYPESFVRNKALCLLYLGDHYAREKDFTQAYIHYQDASDTLRKYGLREELNEVSDLYLEAERLATKMHESIRGEQLLFSYE